MKKRLGDGWRDESLSGVISRAPVELIKIISEGSYLEKLVNPTGEEMEVNMEQFHVRTSSLRESSTVSLETGIDGGGM